MHSSRAVALLLCALQSWGQVARPEFRADRVMPSFADTPLMLAPGMLVSIYGNQLRWETLAPDNPFQVWGRIAIYPARLCGVQVKIGDVFAGLLWAQKEQIDFRCPSMSRLPGARNFT
jgi:uncharacterized protein (TIGR03437 family)